MFFFTSVHFILCAVFLLKFCNKSASQSRRGCEAKKLDFFRAVKRFDRAQTSQCRCREELMRKVVKPSQGKTGLYWNELGL